MLPLLRLHLHRIKSMVFWRRETSWIPEQVIHNSNQSTSIETMPLHNGIRWYPRLNQSSKGCSNLKTNSDWTIFIYFGAWFAENSNFGAKHMFLFQAHYQTITFNILETFMLFDIGNCFERRGSKFLKNELHREKSQSSSGSTGAPRNFLGPIIGPHFSRKV